MAEQLNLPTSTAVERIFAAVAEQADDAAAPGIKGLRPGDQLMYHQLEMAYSLLQNYKTFDTAWPLMAQRFDLSRATCYRRLSDAMNLFGDLTKVRKTAARAMLVRHAQQLKAYCLEQSPPDLKGAAMFMKLEMTLQGLNRPDTGPEEASGAPVSTSYVINLHVEGRKPKVIDLGKLDSISDADVELVDQAVNSAVIDVEQMALMLAERTGQEAGPDARR